MVMDTGEVGITSRLSECQTRVYRVLRLQPCTNREVVNITGLPLNLVQDAIVELSTAGLIVKVRHGRFFSRANALWRYQRPERRYLAGIIAGSVFVPLGVSQFTCFLFVPGIILLGVFVSLFG